MPKKNYISNWGNYPKVHAKIKSPSSLAAAKQFVEEHESLTVRGNGRSYGDSSLAENILSTKNLNKFLSFDTEKGILTCQSGLLLSEILEVIVPEGFFLPVTPGTKFISVGGAIGADVHGKNHHVDGSFSSHLISFELLDKNGALHTCTQTENETLFWQTVGGMGSTGLITKATFSLKPIESVMIRQESLKAENLKEIMGFFEESEDWTYTVAWIDCLQKGANIGRSILMRGEHAKREELSEKQKLAPLAKKEKLNLNIPFFFPGFVLNTLSVKLFNFFFYHKQRKKVLKNLIDYDSFFYPLDSIHNWNRMYSKKGFTQYQFVLPKDQCEKGLREILTTISESGQGSFLAVLKLFGKGSEFAPHTFPEEGYTLALDFPLKKGLDKLLAKLDKLVLQYGGRLYLAKDAFMSKEMFSQTYPDFPTSEKFKSNQQIRLSSSIKKKDPLVV